ncbi:RagB/SusD family nutrient uptake outer membrane protein [Dysgonomonas sp. Marseille-P4361]|uniref:RagB/SusD family nutrient uptake outer membrane protein n=1 Tax=Dysgonomonas sp. Marseille-P4361 TaxID=2161820 RepID=UPI000D54F34F|nr:RagB/SusD family nutrient uptake outer membrane protein [Dysgonomonas sp. Marseille-P4361]
MNVKVYTIKKTITTKIFCIVIAITCGLNSCDYLNIDKYLDDELPYDSIFSNKRYIEAFMWNAASQFHDEGSIYGYPYTPGPMATDEAFCLFGAGEFQGMAYVLGERNSSNLGSLNNWKRWYVIIRQCNLILNRIDEASDWTAVERLNILSHTRFIRAYAYYNLVMNFGPVVLLGDETLNNNEDMPYYDRPRDLYDDCIEYICTEFEEASLYLPAKTNSVVEYGRPTKGAALALVARLRLIHASDLYNGGASARMYFGNWKRKTDGQNYIQQTADPKRWAVAAAAAKRVIDLKDSGVSLYKLHTVEKNDKTRPLPTNVDDPNYHKPFPDGAGGIDPFHSYADMFNGETVVNVNPEFIWARSSGAITSYTQHSFPVANGGWNGLAVPQKIIDAYDMVDGRTINNSSSEYPYDETGFTSSVSELYSGYRLNANVYNMYVNREARFYASIGFSECFWEMASTTDNSQKRLTVTYYSDSPNGKDGASNPLDHPATGYVLRKYINPLDAWAGTGNQRVPKGFPIIRYAEILLAYAEALNQLGGESYTIEVEGKPQIFTRDINEIRKSINLIRYRAGLPGYKESDLADAKEVLNKIKKERMVELLHENHRYFDVRRWGDYESSESEPIKGMNTAGTRESYYQRVVPISNRISNRVVHRKMIFLPIPEVEMRRLPSFDQNPGW